MLKATDVLHGEISKLHKTRLNQVYRMLLQKPCTKEKIAEQIGVKPRMARKYAQLVGVRVAVISHNGEKGYKLAQVLADEPSNLHKINERCSRIKELVYGILPNFEKEREFGFEISTEKILRKLLEELEKPQKIQVIIQEELYWWQDKE